MAQELSPIHVPTVPTLGMYLDITRSNHICLYLYRLTTNLFATDTDGVSTIKPSLGETLRSSLGKRIKVWNTIQYGWDVELVIGINYTVASFPLPRYSPKKNPAIVYSTQSLEPMCSFVMPKILSTLLTWGEGGVAVPFVSGVKKLGALYVAQKKR
ncbi:uncharacterized protein H6S33_003432 [Morchella sextelata]|uniref:uncharacterized protein n=1 Tax=Morchella sextelata TaxID=1174677 RepID=UPI001D0403B1|nr:uncharacterized protein H6S33_003432 [Morchella sextelata]KAH0606598.1 hypothetical protein H6S33_003432 [Morchella sextelata]